MSEPKTTWRVEWSNGDGRWLSMLRNYATRAQAESMANACRHLANVRIIRIETREFVEEER